MVRGTVPECRTPPPNELVDAKGISKGLKMKRTNLLISILAVVLISTVACKNEEKKEMDDYMEEEMMRKLARDMLFPTATTPASTCTTSQVTVRFSNASTSQTFALYSTAGCTTKAVSVTGTTAAANGTLTAFKCAPLSTNGFYPGTDNASTCGGTPFYLAAGNSYTITALTGGYSYDSVY